MSLALDAALGACANSTARAPAHVASRRSAHALPRRLQVLDGELLAAALRRACGPERLAASRGGGDGPGPVPRTHVGAAYRQVVHAAVDRLARDAVGLPTLAFE
jgi:hypothetical protein